VRLRARARAGVLVEVKGGMAEGEGKCMAYSGFQVGRVQLHLFGGTIGVAVAVVSLQRVDALVAAVLARFLFILTT